MAIIVIHPIRSSPAIDSWIKVIITLNQVLVIYPNSAGVLFLSLALVVSKYLQIFTERISDQANYQKKVGRKLTLPNQKDDDERMLDDWKRIYLLIDHLVDELNRSFGLPLLIIFSSVVVRMINNLFKVMMSFNVEELDGSYNGRIHFFFMDLFNIVLAAYVSNRIKKEVFKCKIVMKYLN